MFAMPMLHWISYIQINEIDDDHTKNEIEPKRIVETKLGKL